MNSLRFFHSTHSLELRSRNKNSYFKKKAHLCTVGFFCCCCFPKVWFSKPKRESPPGFRQPAQLESLSLWWAGKLPEEKNPSIPGENKRAWKYAMVATVPFLECLYFQWQGSREQLNVYSGSLGSNPRQDSGGVIGGQGGDHQGAVLLSCSVSYGQTLVF